MFPDDAAAAELAVAVEVDRTSQPPFPPAFMAQPKQVEDKAYAGDQCDQHQDLERPIYSEEATKPPGNAEREDQDPHQPQGPAT